MIKFSLKPNKDGTFKSARVANKNVIMEDISPFQLKQHMKDCVENKNDLEKLRNFVKLFKVHTVTINKKDKK